MESQRKRERTKVGMARARAQGEVLGRPLGSKDRRKRKRRQIIIHYKSSYTSIYLFQFFLNIGWYILYNLLTCFFYNIYSIHGLIMALRDVGVNDSMVNEWMGWRSGNPAAPMVSTYSYGDKEINAKVQKKHPFIKLWK